MVASLSALNYFMPIFAFLFVFILVYAVLKKTKVLGDNDFVALFLPFIFATFFIVNVSLVEFVKSSTSWFVVFLVCLFMIILLISFTHGKVEAIMKPWFAWVLLIALIVFFIVSSAYVFHWVINWTMILDWFYTDWFGLVLLLAIAGVVSWILTKK